MHVVSLIIGAGQRAERERVLIGGKEVRLDSVLGIEPLAQPCVARLVIGRKLVAGHRIVGEDKRLGEMPRGHGGDRLARGRRGQHGDPVDETEIGARRLQGKIEPLRVHRQEHHLPQRRSEIVRGARADVGERRRHGPAGLAPGRRAEASRRSFQASVIVAISIKTVEDRMKRFAVAAAEEHGVASRHLGQ